MKKLIVRGVMVFLLLLGFQTSSQATPILTLNDNNGNVVSVTDNLAGDLNSVLGAVTYLGPIGAWNINVSTGVTKPAQGSPTEPYIDLNSINTGIGHLTITFSESGFTQFGGVVLNVGGTTQGTATFQTLVNGSPVATLGPFSPVAFSGTANGLTGAPSGPSSSYTLSLVADIFHQSAVTDSFDASVSVPEPASVLLLGLGLLGLGFIKRKKK